ncbi:MAG: FkbM family methyltransferase [Candidatus Aenigmarchaeota archaeon]|nr:FkbM family methyltransferase [Candidatus Aenigmarchaeota archaeon]
MRNLLFRAFKKSVKSLSGRGLSRKWPISSLYKFFFYHLKPDFVEFEGHKIYLPKKDIGDVAHDISILNTWVGKGEINVFKHEIKRGDIVIDLGAHIGYYTLLAAKLVGDNGRVYAFEPDPNNFECLKKNVEENGYKNITCINKAVSNKTGKTKLFFSDETDNSQIINSDDGKFVIVDVTSLDDYFNNNQSADFIKMDIEGSEGRALQGMTNLLKNSRNIKILTEFFPDKLQFAIDAKKYLEMLEGHKFKFYDIDTETGKLRPVTKEHLIETYNIGKKKFESGRVTNILCLR